MPSMTLARVWRRQLLSASTAALIVPSAMLAALVALALGGAFGGVGVLGQLFAGPSLSLGGPTAGAHPGSGGSGSGARASATSLPVIPAVAPAPAVRRPVVGGPRPGRTLLTASRGPSGAGGAIGGGGAVHPVTLGGGTGGGPGGGSGGRPARVGRVRRVFGVRAGVRLWVTGT